MEEKIVTRDFTSVTPSARWMILWKGHTNIPFAREVADWLESPAKYVPDFKKRDFTFWASTLGLERRYYSINQLLDDLSIGNILELSSGYSFRGLAYARQKGVYYIDTDLPEVIASKKEMLDSIQMDQSDLVGKLELLPLNALDKDGFQEIIGHFPPGEVVVVNEGLLGYLVRQEKELLCSIVHAVLKERGGYWITADIGLKDKESKLGLHFTDEIQEFNKQQDTEGNSFESFKEAESFFNDMGFVLEKEANTKYKDMSSFKYMVRSMTLKQLFKLQNRGNIMATWRLKAV